MKGNLDEARCDKDVGANIYIREKLSIEPTTIVEKTKSSSLRPKFGREAMSPITQAPTPTTSSMSTLKGNCGSALNLSFQPLRNALKRPAFPTGMPPPFPSSSPFPSPFPPPCPSLFPFPSPNPPLPPFSLSFGVFMRSSLAVEEDEEEDTRSGNDEVRRAADEEDGDDEVLLEEKLETQREGR